MSVVGVGQERNTLVRKHATSLCAHARAGDRHETACGERMSCQLERRAGKATSGGVIAHLVQCNIGT